MAATNNPMEGGDGTSESEPELVPSTTYHIAGILTTVYGLDTLPPQEQCTSITILWLLHPRLQTHACMAPVAAAMIRAWYAHRSSSQSAVPGTGLLCVAFDQRNHGSRSALPLANQAWRQDNPTHAVDMFGIYAGTAKDVSMLIDFLPAYLPLNGRAVDRHLVLGISLGGHAVWHVLLHEPRVDAGVAVIGCPDYTAVMTDRAEKSKLQSWSQSSGRDFVGGPDFPPALVQQVAALDPAGLLMRDGQKLEVASRDAAKLQAIMRPRLANKRILVLSGGKDKLVPYKCGEEFMQWLNARAMPDGGIFSDDDRLVIEDIQDPDAGHEYSSLMKKEAARFIVGCLATANASTSRNESHGPKRDIKI